MRVVVAQHFPRRYGCFVFLFVVLRFVNVSFLLRGHLESPRRGCRVSHGIDEPRNPTKNWEVAVRVPGKPTGICFLGDGGFGREPKRRILFADLRADEWSARSSRLEGRADERCVVLHRLAQEGGVDAVVPCRHGSEAARRVTIA